MAIIKSITLNNGVTVNYHRVVSVNNITNNSSIIEVASYTSKEKRQEEKNKILTGKPMDIYIDTQYLNKEYSSNLTVESAYEYIKSLEVFKGASNDN